MSSVKIAVIDREGFYIDAVVTVLEQQPDMEVVASATIFEDFVRQSDGAEIAVLQQEQSSSHTRRLIRELCDALPEIDVIVLGAAEDETVLVSYIEAGAFGYVRDSESFDQLLQVIRVIKAGETLIHPELAAPLVRRLAELGRMAHHIMPLDLDDVRLTDRQHEVMELIAKGKSNQEIADALYISVGTVKNHVHKIFERLQVSSRDQAASVYAQIVERTNASKDRARHPDGAAASGIAARDGAQGS